MNDRIITDKATLELATAQAAKSILDRIDTLEQELVDERYSKRKVQARHDDLAAELVEVRRLWSEATASQCRISGNYDVLVVKNEQLEAALQCPAARHSQHFCANCGNHVGSFALETKGEQG